MPFHVFKISVSSFYSPSKPIKSVDRFSLLAERLAGIALTNNLLQALLPADATEAVNDTARSIAIAPDENDVRAPVFGGVF